MPITDVSADSREVTLRRWRVVEVEEPGGTRSRHVLGHDVTNSLGRASSTIMQFDLDTMTATTRSGTKYKLIGLPGNSLVGKFAWEKWRSDNAIVSELDVTKEYLNVDQLSTVGFAKINNALTQQDSAD